MAFQTTDVNSKLNVCLRIKPSPAKTSAYASDNNKLRVTSSRGTETFQFTKIFRENSSQTEVFDATTKDSVNNFLNGEDCLSFAYGTTNAGKTFSVQGSKSEPGLIPRSVKHIFNCVGSAIDDNPRIAPLNYKQAQIRNAKDRLLNDQIKASIINSTVSPPSVVPPAEVKFSISFAPVLSSTICDYIESGHSPSLLPQSFDKDSKCSLWISMLEVYNENVYDLLAPLPKGPAAAKYTVKLLSDGMGNFIPQGNVEVNVSNLREANAILTYGQKQRTTVATLLNITSSRSHCILRVRLLRVDRVVPTSPLGPLSPAADVDDFHVSTFMFIDLAGSERVDKAGTLKDRARETGNINSSLLVLGRCMEMLKLKGASSGSSKNSVVPYRESKLTMILQPLLSVSGPKSLLVNINTSPDLFEETMNVLKFSCVARCVVFKDPPKPAAKSKLPVSSLPDVSSQPADNESNSSDPDSGISNAQYEEMQKIREELETKLTNQLDETQKMREMFEIQLKNQQQEMDKMQDKFKLQLQERCEESKKLQAAMSSLQAEHYERENEIKKNLQNEFEIIEQEMDSSHKEALANKETQLITLMEKRLDVQESYYKEKLSEKSAEIECCKEYNKTLENAIVKWEDFGKNSISQAEISDMKDLHLTEINLKTIEIMRLNTINEENVLEIFNLKENVAALTKTQHSSLEESRVHEEDLLSEIKSLQNEIKTQMSRIQVLANNLDEKDNRIKGLKESKNALRETLTKLQFDNDKYHKLAKFVLNEYHPSARDSLATHNEEETWAIIEREFKMEPSRCQALEKENFKLKEKLELAQTDYRKLEERRDAQLSKFEDEIKAKNSQLELEKREVQALQKQLMGMTPRQVDGTPQRFQLPELKTPMSALSSSMRSLNVNTQSPSVSTNKTLPVVKPDDLGGSKPMTRSTGRKKKVVAEKENSPHPAAEKESKPVKKRATRRKLCPQSVHPALDSNGADEVFNMEEADFKVPEENEVQKTRRRLRSTYK